MHRSAIAVLASGRGSNLKSILEAMKDPAYPAEVTLVLSDVRDAPALDAARAAGIEAIAIDSDRKGPRFARSAEATILSALAEREIRCLVLAGFMRILSRSFLRSFDGPVLNIHPSLLPAFPGLDAQGQALRHGVRIAGATVHLVDEGIDTGPIVGQSAVPVHANDTREALADRILETEHRLFPESIRKVLTVPYVIEGRRLRFHEEETSRS